MGKRSLKEVGEYTKLGLVSIDVQADERLDEFEIDEADIENALVNATSCRSQPNGRWLVRGLDLDGNKLKVLVEVTSRILVVTAS